NAGVLWVNTLLLPAGLRLLALSASCLWRPTLFKLALLLMVLVFALHVHLVAVVGAPIVAILVVSSAREAFRHRLSRRETVTIAILAIAAFGPYAVAEGITGFGNSRAMLAHLQQTGE